MRKLSYGIRNFFTAKKMKIFNITWQEAMQNNVGFATFPYASKLNPKNYVNKILGQINYSCVIGLQICFVRGIVGIGFV